VDVKIHAVWPVSANAAPQENTKRGKTTPNRAMLRGILNHSLIFEPPYFPSSSKVREHEDPTPNESNTNPAIIDLNI
jgi:hypothetical protein